MESLFSLTSFVMAVYYYRLININIRVVRACMRIYIHLYRFEDAIILAYIQDNVELPVDMHTASEKPFH